MECLYNTELSAKFSMVKTNAITIWSKTRGWRCVIEPPSLWFIYLVPYQKTGQALASVSVEELVSWRTCELIFSSPIDAI